VLLDADVDAPFSCMQGTCGTCEVAVLDGVPDHRDAILTEAERAAGETMMICCSGSKSKRLVIDL
jgi:ferredoxin